MEKIVENNKRIAKNILMLYIRMFFIMAVTLYTSRVILKVLGVEDFGIYNVVGGVVSMMGFLKGSMSAATTRFITYELGRGDDEQLHKTYCVSIMIYAFICLFFVIAAETIGLWFLNTQLVIPDERMTAANWIYQFTIASLVVEMMAQPYNAVIIAHERMSFFAYVSIVEVFLRLIVVYALLVVPSDHLATYGLLMLCVSVSIRLIYGIYCKRHFVECRFRLYRDGLLFRKLLSYSSWNLFGSLSTVVKGQGLNILLNMFFTPAVNAARGIAFQISNAISQFSQNFYTAVRPQITKYYAQGDLKNMFQLVFRSSRYSFYLNLLFTVPLLLETPYIIALWLGQVPDYVVEFSRLIIVISAIGAMEHPIMTATHATGRVALYQSVVGTMNILNIPISYVFLLLGFPPLTVFWVSLVISVICVFVRLAIIKYLIPQFPVVTYIYKVLVTCLLVTVVSFVIPALVHYYSRPNGLLSCTIVVILSLVSVLTTVSLLGMEKGERKYVLSIVKKKIFHRR